MHDSLALLGGVCPLAVEIDPTGIRCLCSNSTRILWGRWLKARDSGLAKRNDHCMAAQPRSGGGTF